MSSKRNTERDMQKRFAHIAKAIEQKASRLWDGSGSGKTMHDAVDYGGRHPAFPENPQSISGWDEPLGSTMKSDPFWYKQNFEKDE